VRGNRRTGQLALTAAVLGLASAVLVGCSSATPDTPTVGAAGTSSTAGTSTTATPNGTSGAASPTGDPLPAVIPGTVTAVTVRVNRLTATPAVTRTLTGVSAQQLAAVVNGLGPRKPGVNCLIRSGFTDTLTFTAGSQAPTVLLTLDPCGSIAVSGLAGGVAAARQLSGASALDRAVMTALGLPAEYGH
jgi:hypothetical protein